MGNCPIDGLPSELLSRIFVTLNEASLYARSIEDESYGRVDYPTLLSSVCFHWRHIAINTPDLWSCITINVVGDPVQRLERINHHLHRAPNTPLRIRIGTFAMEWLHRRVDSSLEFLLRSSAPRLESLAISYLHLSFAKEAISTLFSEGGTTTVTRLSLFAHSGYKNILVGDEFLPQEYLDRLFERLKSLYLVSVSLDWDHLACRNLVELQLIFDGPPSIQQLLNLLRVNPCLRFVKFGWSLHSSAPLEPNLELIQLPHLEVLDLQMEQWFIDWFISRLVPGPHDLAVYLAAWGFELDRSDITGAFLAFAGRARIVSLHITDRCLLIHRLYDCLPHLRTLRLSSQMIEPAMIAGLQQAAHPLPQLQVFEILSCGYNMGAQCGPQAMRKLQCLKKIKFRRFELEVDGNRMSSEEIVEWFKKGYGDGRIEVVDSPELGFSVHASPFR